MVGECALSDIQVGGCRVVVHVVDGVQYGVLRAVLYYVAFCLVDIWRWNFDGVGVLPQAVSGLGSS